MGVFSALDLLLFYILFEGILIPMFLLIGIWGSREEKVRASYYFFFYTLIGSVFMLLGIFQLKKMLTNSQSIFLKINKECTFIHLEKRLSNHHTKGDFSSIS